MFFPSWRPKDVSFMPFLLTNIPGMKWTPLRTSKRPKRPFTLSEKNDIRPTSMSLNLIQRFQFSPWFSQLVVIRKCNLSCGYCNEFDKSSDPIPLETLKARLRKLKELGTFAVNLTG